MASSPENDPATYFGFTDLHGFKDFVGLVLSCAPDLFLYADWLRPDEQMNLDRAFIGLRYGLDLATREKGPSPVFTACREHVEKAYALYKADENYAGQLQLEEVEKLLRKIPSR